jgi:hypothetical protein
MEEMIGTVRLEYITLKLDNNNSIHKSDESDE